MNFHIHTFVLPPAFQGGLHSQPNASWDCSIDTLNIFMEIIEVTSIDRGIHRNSTRAKDLVLETRREVVVDYGCPRRQSEGHNVTTTATKSWMTTAPGTATEFSIWLVNTAESICLFFPFVFDCRPEVQRLKQEHQG